MNPRDSAKIVVDILEKNPAARDSDNILYGDYLKKIGYNIDRMDVFTLLKLIDNETLHSMETLARARRLVQVQSPTLRGTIFFKRHKLAEQLTAEFR